MNKGADPERFFTAVTPVFSHLERLGSFVKPAPSFSLSPHLKSRTQHSVLNTHSDQ